jgi:hypothetical protein
MYSIPVQLLFEWPAPAFQLRSLRNGHSTFITIFKSGVKVSVDFCLEKEERVTVGKMRCRARMVALN